MENNNIHLKAKIEMVSICQVDEEALLQRREYEWWRLEDKQRRRDGGEEDVSADDVTSHESIDAPTNRIYALEGYLSKELGTISRTPGWHRLPNGVAVYSDATADKFLDPEGMVNDKWKKSMTLMTKPGREGIWCQLENLKDYNEQGDLAFRYLVPSWDPHRALTFIRPSGFEDFYEEGSEVPVAPYPSVKHACVRLNGMMRMNVYR